MIKIDKTKKIDISIIGRVTIDFNPTDYYNTLDKNKNFNIYVGGSAGNIAIGVARYNRNVNFISRVSKDQFGTFITNTMKNEKMDINEIQIDNFKKIGLTFTEMLNDQESNLLMYREEVADLEINKNKISEKKISDSKICLISGVSLAKEPSRSACKYVRDIANKNKIPLIFDLDYRPYTWKTFEETSKEYFDVATKSNILIGSQEEFDFLLGKKENNIQDYESFFKKMFNEYKIEIIILKLGSKGSILYTKDKKIQIGIVKVKLLKGFGGGDAFASSFINSLLNEDDMKMALSYATCAASMVVSSLSSSESLPTNEQLKEFYEKNKFEKLPEEISW